MRLSRVARNVFRQDAATGEWVVFATGRANRPQQTVTAKAKQKGSEAVQHDLSCPFCPGNEHLTPPTKLQYGGDKVGSHCARVVILPRRHASMLQATGEGWQLRVISNKFPAVQDPTTAAVSDR